MQLHPPYKVQVFIFNYEHVRGTKQPVRTNTGSPTQHRHKSSLTQKVGAF